MVEQLPANLDDPAPGIVCVCVRVCVCVCVCGGRAVVEGRSHKVFFFFSFLPFKLPFAFFLGL